MFSLYLSSKATGFTPQPAADTAISSSKQDLFVRSLPAAMRVGSYRSGSIRFLSVGWITGSSWSSSYSFSPVERFLAKVSSSPLSFCWMHRISRSGSHMAWFSSCEKAQTCPRPHIRMGSGPFHIPVQGSFHLALANVVFVPLCHNLSAADCSWTSVFRKFSINNAWFKALCGLWGYNSPVFIFCSCVFQELCVHSTISCPWGL